MSIVIFYTDMSIAFLSIMCFHVIVSNNDVNNAGPFKPPRSRPAVKLYDHRDHNIDRLRRSVALYDWSYVKSATDITMYARFLEAISQLLRDNIPVNVVRLRLRDPPI